MLYYTQENERRLNIVVATGIVRRIDELGRVVIPREIRRALRIHDGDPLEMYRDGTNLVLRKYQSDDITESAKALKEYLFDEPGINEIFNSQERVAFQTLLDKILRAKEDNN